MRFLPNRSVKSVIKIRGSMKDKIDNVNRDRKQAAGYHGGAKHYNKRTYGRSDLVCMLYRVSPMISDACVKSVISTVFGSEPTDGVMSVWKHRARKKGIWIPDGRVTAV